MARVSRYGTAFAGWTSSTTGGSHEIGYQTRCVMRFSKGLTTWCVRVGPTALMWQWNMPLLGEAMRTRGMRTLGRHGYLTAGPLIVEW